ncbi:MAG: SDR family oxidoreductase [Moraxellaceae bacterium]|nr:SDR family oxidoreductase [Moraxellaceae bacterium]
MKIHNATAFVTGANRGLGRAFVQALLAAGARKVYAAARNPASIDFADARVVPVRLDVTDPAQVAEAARIASDTDLLINNAGISQSKPFLDPASVDTVRIEMETNFYGPLLLGQAFAPALKANGGGAMLNVLSVLSWVALAGSGTYSASKAAAWSMTNALRNELRSQGTQVTGLHVGFMDTDMVRHVEAPKSKPEDVVAQALQAIEAGAEEVLADDISRQVKAGLSAEQSSYLTVGR